MQTTNNNGSIVIIIPAPFIELCNQLGVVMGWGDGSFTVPLTMDGVNIHFFGLRSEYDEKFGGWFLGRDELPIQVRNIPNINLLLENILIDISPNVLTKDGDILWGKRHFKSVCEKMGLTIHREYGMITDDSSLGEVTWAYDPSTLPTENDLSLE